jgi:signal transduction histidine kinase
VAAVVFVVAVVRAAANGGQGSDIAYVTLRDTAGGLLLLTGMVQVVVWALTGKAARALDGAALLLLGVGLVAFVGPYGDLLDHNARSTLISPGCRLTVGVPVLALLLYSPRSRPIDSVIRPLRVLAYATTGSLALLGCLVLLRLRGPLDGPVAGPVAMALLAAGWLAAAARRLLGTSGEPRRARELWLGPVMICFGVGDVGLALALRHGVAWGIVGSAVQLIASAGMLVVATSWLLEGLRRDGNRMLRIAGELHDRTEILATEQAMQERLVHDARNMLAAIRTANVTLDRYGQRLDEPAQERLRGAVGSEFDRLSRLLDLSHARDLECFEIEPVVAPIVQAGQQAGADISLTVSSGLCALGRPSDTAAVLQALLVNAAQHAPGSAVEVWSEASEHDVRLIVADHGPGVPDSLREAIFRRGTGANRDEVGGRGLHISRRLMTGQDGALALETHEGWGTYAVMTLPIPAASTEQA